MKKSSFIHLIVAASFTTLIACQKIKKAEQASFSDWQKVEEDELKTLEKEAGGKLKSILNCRVRPVENYHIYYTLDFSEKAASKDTKQDNTPIKLYDEAVFGNYFYGNSNKTNNKTKIKTKKVKVLVKKEELINTYEIYEKVDSSQITRAEEEDLKKMEEKKKLEEEAKKKQASEQEQKQVAGAAQETKNIATTTEAESTKVETAKLSEVDAFKKGYHLIFSVKKHAVTDEVKSITNYSNNTAFTADAEGLKGATLECQ